MSQEHCALSNALKDKAGTAYKAMLNALEAGNGKVARDHRDEVRI